MGGVGLFLYGIKLMGDSLQDLAGDRMRTLISSLTSSPVKGALVGALVTMVLHSSGATTIMAVSFVQAGMMTLRQALGVIMGANVGTTVTAQMIAFNIKEAALPLIGIGMMMAVFGRSKRTRYIGNGVFGFGLLFLGMDTMEHAMAFLRERKDIFLMFSDSPMLCLLVGMLMTIAVQSSTATVVLTIAMATQGLLPLNSAIAVLLGNNMGTTFTAVIASLGASREAKQAAAGHVMFNLIGLAIFMPLLAPYTKLIAGSAHSISHQLANAHTFFNIANTAIQLPFINLLARLIERILPSTAPAICTGPRYLDKKLLSTSPAAAVTAVRNELLNMGGLTLEMLELVKKAYTEHDDGAIDQLLRIEDVVNNLTHKISSFAAKLWQKHISSDLSKLLESYLNGAGDLERVGDHAKNMIEMYEFLRDHKLLFSESGKKEFLTMYTLMHEMLEKSIEAVRTESVPLAEEVAVTLEEQLDAMEETLRHMHIQRLNGGKCNPSSGVVFIDLVSNMERIGDHAHNVAKIVSDIARLHGVETISHKNKNGASATETPVA